MAQATVKDEMALPAGKTCADCEWFERRCSWLVSAKPEWTSCDFYPVRFFARPTTPQQEKP